MFGLVTKKFLRKHLDNVKKSFGNVKEWHTFFEQQLKEVQKGISVIEADNERIRSWVSYPVKERIYDSLEEKIYAKLKSLKSVNSVKSKKLNSVKSKKLNSVKSKKLKPVTSVKSPSKVIESDLTTMEMRAFGIVFFLMRELKEEFISVRQLVQELYPQDWERRGSTVSNYLKALRDHGLIISERRGSNRYVKMTDEGLRLVGDLNLKHIKKSLKSD